MRRVIASLVLVLVALFMIAPVTVAQTQPATSGIYTVMPGDTGWDLSRQHYDDAAIWQRIVDLNPFLHEAGRLFEKDGKIILLLKPGEKLAGLENLNVPAPVAVPISQLVTPATTPAVKSKASTSFNWLWLIPVALIIWWALIMWASWSRRRNDEQTRREERERELGMDPITSGTPYVPGGIASTDGPRLTNFFDQQAVNRYALRNPTIDRTTIRATRIGPVENGTITGEGMVGYLGGDFRPRRIEQPLAAYRARYRFPDGTEEDLITLQACMNPVNFGGDTYRGFTFTTLATIVPIPEPERPAPVAAPHPAMAIRAIRTEAESEGRSTLTIGGRVIIIERGAHISVDEQTGKVLISGSSFDMAVTPKRRRTGRTTRATGTSD